MTTAIPDGLVQHIANRDQQRADAVRQRLDELTPRERMLVHEAAVMGYVQGVRAVSGSWQQQIPADNSIVHTVIDACRSFDDLYPLLAGQPDALARRIVRNHQPVTFGRLVRAVSGLTNMPVEEAEVIVEGLIAEGLLVETGGGLREAP
jgi:hypothetical protein